MVYRTLTTLRVLDASDLAMLSAIYIYIAIHIYIHIHISSLTLEKMIMILLLMYVMAFLLLVKKGENPSRALFHIIDLS